MCKRRRQSQSDCRLIILRRKGVTCELYVMMTDYCGENGIARNFIWEITITGSYGVEEKKTLSYLIWFAFEWHEISNIKSAPYLHQHYLTKSCVILICLHMDSLMCSPLHEHFLNCSIIYSMVYIHKNFLLCLRHVAIYNITLTLEPLKVR